jgi:hypothetical protein
MANEKLESLFAKLIGVTRKSLHMQLNADFSLFVGSADEARVKSLFGDLDAVDQYFADKLVMSEEPSLDDFLDLAAALYVAAFSEQVIAQFGLAPDEETEESDEETEEETDEVAEDEQDDLDNLAR